VGDFHHFGRLFADQCAIRPNRAIILLGTIPISIIVVIIGPVSPRPDTASHI